MKRTLQRTLAFALSAALLALAPLALAGCGKTANTVAATVNGTEIAEADVTAYIENMRNGNPAYADDAAWLAALTFEGLTPATLRDQVIEQFIYDELVRQDAAAKSIVVEESVIDTSIAELKTGFADDAAWQTALAASGFADEAAYKAFLTQSTLEMHLMDQVVEEQVPTAEELDAYVAANAQRYVGKRSSHILFSVSSEDEAASAAEEAGKVLKAVLKDKGKFTELAGQYSDDTVSAASGGDVGWDFDATFVDGYQTALDKLEAGEVCDELVETEFGLHIIMCTDAFVLPEGRVVTYADFKGELAERVKGDLVEQKREKAFDAYVLELRKAADIVIYEMPEGLSYDIDVDAINAGGSGLNSDDSASGMDAAATNPGDAAGAGEGDAQGAQGAQGTDASNAAGNAGGSAGGEEIPPDGTAAVNENYHG